MVTIMQGQHFTLQSAGNGFCYLLCNTEENADAFFQGEDAIDFKADLEMTEEHHPDWSVDAVLAWLWDQCDYGSAASPIK